MSQKKMTEEQKALAKRLYMEYVPTTEIAKRIGFSRGAINHHALGPNGWKEQRELVKNELLTELAESKAAQITKIYGTSLEVLTRFINELKNRPDPLTMQEAKNLSNILDSIDKIVRLDQGTPTDIIADTKPATVIEIREALKADPFLEYTHEDDSEDDPDFI